MVISCPSVREDLSGFLDRQLTEARHSQVEAHLAACLECSRELDTLKSLSRFLTRATQENFPVPDIWAGLSKRLPTVCEVIQEDLSAYLDGELPAAAQEGVNQHLKECSPCKEQFGRLNNTNQLISKGLKLPEEVKIDLWPAVKSRLNEDCALIQSELSAFIDQEVATLRHRTITSHLMDCPMCRTRFEELSQVGDCIRTFYQPVMPENLDLWPGIKKQMQVVPFAAKAPKAQPRILNHRLYLVGAAAVMLGLCGSLVFLFTVPTNTTGIQPVSAEAYLLDSALKEPADSAEAVVYENQ